MDYYGLLGVSPGASVADIKRAYRRLSRLHHPGINPGDRASEELYQRISEAYETLVDPERRRRYDTADAGPSGQDHGSFAFTGFDFTVSARGPQAATFTELFADVLHPLPRAERGRAESGADLHAALNISFEEALNGVERQVVVTRQVPCGVCAGVGQVATSGGSCAKCRGAGQVRWARGHMVFTGACADCGGSGREQLRRCSACAGMGRTVRSEGIVVRIPAGVMNGSRIRIPERGHAGRSGGSSGDLYVDIQVRPHPLVRQDGDDLHMVVPVGISEAALGARIEFTALDGPVHLRIPPGTQAGRRIRISGRGAPSGSDRRGDLYIEVQIVLPESLDERSKELLREFGRLNAGNPRRGLPLNVNPDH
jgi:molecular chaperone DnaJ